MYNTDWCRRIRSRAIGFRDTRRPCRRPHVTAKSLSPNVLISSFFCRLSNESGRVAQLPPGSRLFVALSHMHAQPAARLHRAHSDASLGTLPLVFCNLPPTAASARPWLSVRRRRRFVNQKPNGTHSGEVEFINPGQRCPVPSPWRSVNSSVLTTVCRDQRQGNDSLQPDRPAARYKAIAGGGGEVRRR